MTFCWLYESLLHQFCCSHKFSHHQYKKNIYIYIYIFCCSHKSSHHQYKTIYILIINVLLFKKKFIRLPKIKHLSIYIISKKKKKPKHLSRLSLFQFRLPFFLILYSFFWFLKFTPTSTKLKLSKPQCRR